MENTLNKLKNLYNNIIYTNKHLINIILNTIFHIYKYRNRSKKDFFECISLIPFTELQSYCDYGYNLPNVYIIYEYINKNKEFYREILHKNKDDKYFNNHSIYNIFYFPEKYNIFKYYILIYIIFFINEETYNKLFKDLLMISRYELFNYFKKREKCFKISYIYNKYSIDYNFNIQNHNFNNDLFLIFQDVFYDSFNNNFRCNHQMMGNLLFILESIIVVIFLPITNIINNINIIYSNDNQLIIEQLIMENDSLIVLNIKKEKYNIFSTFLSYSIIIREDEDGNEEENNELIEQNKYIINDISWLNKKLID